MVVFWGQSPEKPFLHWHYIHNVLEYWIGPTCRCFTCFPEEWSTRPRRVFFFFFVWYRAVYSKILVSLMPTHSRRSKVVKKNPLECLLWEWSVVTIMALKIEQHRMEFLQALNKKNSSNEPILTVMMDTWSYCCTCKFMTVILPNGMKCIILEFLS